MTTSTARARAQAARQRSRSQPLPQAEATRGQIARALELCGDRWTLLIVHEIAPGTTRFGNLHRALGISRTVLNKRLLTEGIVERQEYRPHNGWSDHHQLALYPAISALILFASQYLEEP